MSVSWRRWLSIYSSLLTMILNRVLWEGMSLMGSLNGSRRDSHVVVPMMESDRSHWLMTFLIRPSKILWLLAWIIWHSIFASILHDDVLVECYLMSCKYLTLSFLVLSNLESSLLTVDSWLNFLAMHSLVVPRSTCTMMSHSDVLVVLITENIFELMLCLHKIKS